MRLKDESQLMVRCLCGYSLVRSDAIITFRRLIDKKELSEAGELVQQVGYSPCTHCRGKIGEILQVLGHLDIRHFQTIEGQKSARPQTVLGWPWSPVPQDLRSPSPELALAPGSSASPRLTPHFLSVAWEPFPLLPKADVSKVVRNT